MTNFLLGMVFLVLLALLVQNHRHHARLMTWLDALGDMLGDMLGTITDRLQNESKDDDDQK